MVLSINDGDYFSACKFVHEEYNKEYLFNIFKIYLNSNGYYNEYNILKIEELNKSIDNIYFIEIKFGIEENYSLEYMEIEYSIINDFMISFNRNVKLKKILN